MTDLTKLPLVLWIVQVFDRKRATPFPLENHSLRLRWDKCSKAQIQEILIILENKKQRDVPSPLIDGDDKAITFSLGTSNAHDGIRKFRIYFEPINTAGISALDGQFEGFETIITDDYIEDEEGNEITQDEMIAHVQGHDKFVIIGDTRSVLRFGPNEIKNKEGWTAEKSNTVAHFLELIQSIYQSKWNQSAKFITTVFSESTEKLTTSQLPGLEEFNDVIAKIRQLSSTNDKLLLNVCDIYLEHTSNELKHRWVSQVKNSFLPMLRSKPAIPHDTEYPRIRIIELFMYGARVLHSENESAWKQLENFRKENGLEKSHLLLNQCMVDIFSIAVKIYHVIKQDYTEWLKEGIPRSNRQTPSEIFDLT